MVLNITYNGMSADVDLGDAGELLDNDLRRIATEIVRSSSSPFPYQNPLPSPEVFDTFVVDRFNTPEGGQRFFLRPKVPFGGEDVHE